jgi:hypothetical protein
VIDVAEHANHGPITCGSKSNSAKVLIQTSQSQQDLSNGDKHERSHAKTCGHFSEFMQHTLGETAGDLISQTLGLG